MTKTDAARGSLTLEQIALWSPLLWFLPSMLQGPASRTVRLISRVHPRPVNAPGRPLLLPQVSGGYAPAALSVRHYAQTPPGGQGLGGGGFPGFKLPMQQQYTKGDALKEFVRAPLVVFLVYSLTRSFIAFAIVVVEQRLDGAGKVRKA
jgi:hypothetical protein